MDEVKYEPAVNGRVTLGEVNRNVLAMRDDFKEYKEEHGKVHETHRLEHRNDWRWLVTAGIAVGAFFLSIVDGLGGK